jgi:hypothetical protein
MLRVPTSSLKSATTNIEKAPPQPLLLPENLKPQSKSKTEPKKQPPGKLAHTKLLLLQPKRKPVKQRAWLVDSIIPKPTHQQLPTSKKAVYFNNYYQTNPKPGSKPETNPRKQPEKTPLHTGKTNNYQRENKKDCNKIGIKQKRKAKQPKT